MKINFLQANKFHVYTYAGLKVLQTYDNINRIIQNLRILLRMVLRSDEKSIVA